MKTTLKRHHFCRVFLFGLGIFLCFGSPKTAPQKIWLACVGNMCPGHPRWWRFWIPCFYCHVPFSWCTWSSPIATLGSEGIFFSEQPFFLKKKHLWLEASKKSRAPRIIGPSYKGVWTCIAGFWDLQTTSFDIPWFLGWVFFLFLLRMRFSFCWEMCLKVFFFSDVFLGNQSLGVGIFT